MESENSGSRFANPPSLSSLLLVKIVHVGTGELVREASLSSLDLRVRHRNTRELVEAAALLNRLLLSRRCAVC